MTGLKPRGSMRVLHLDIETTPAQVWTYGLWNQNIGIGQIERPPEIMGWATRWHGEPASTCKYEWSPQWAAPGHEKDPTFERLWEQLDEATHVVHFNGKTFDMPWINHEFIKQGVNGGRPPSPYKQIDLMKQLRRNVRSISNKLAFLSTDLLGFEGKVEANALTLFLEIYRAEEAMRTVLPGSDAYAKANRAWGAARAKLERYCRQDVNLMPKMLDAALPWITGLNTNAYTGELNGCPNCGGTRLQKRGSAYTLVSRFQRYRCNDCGTWSRDKKSLDITGIRNAS